MAVHSLEPTPDTVTQFFSPATPAVLTVDPGDALVVRSLDARGHLERPDRRASDTPKMFNPRRGHCLAGPIAIRGAEPGMTLAVQLRSLRPAAGGFTEAGAHHTDLNHRLGVTGGPTAFLVWDLDPDKLTGTCGVAATRLAPVLRVLWVAPAEASWSRDRRSPCRSPCPGRCSASAMATPRRATARSAGPRSSAA